MKECGVCSAILLCLGIEALSWGIAALWGSVVLWWLIKAAAEGGAY